MTHGTAPGSTAGRLERDARPPLGVATVHDTTVRTGGLGRGDRARHGVRA